jgi:hypothetical protein
MDPMARRKTGRVSRAEIKTRFQWPRSSSEGPAAEAATGSSAIPHVGQAAGFEEKTAGSMGQK